MTAGTPGTPGHSADTPYDGVPPDPERHAFTVLGNLASDRNLVAWKEPQEGEGGGYAVVIAWAGGAPLYPIHSAVRLSSTDRIVVADYLADYDHE